MDFVIITDGSVRIFKSPRNAIAINTRVLPNAVNYSIKWMECGSICWLINLLNGRSCGDRLPGGNGELGSLVIMIYFSALPPRTVILAVH